MSTVDELRRALERPPTQVAGDREASVAAVFNPELELLLIRRAEHPKDPWSGHVSLPGGRAEEGDEDHVATAIRETQEEVGLGLERAQLLGPLDELAAIGGRPGLIIRPFVFMLPSAVTKLSLNGAEVADSRWVPLAWLLSDEGRGQRRYNLDGYDLMLPEVRFPGGWNGARLWGLTLRMVDDLLHRIDGRGQGLARLHRP